MAASRGLACLERPAFRTALKKDYMSRQSSTQSSRITEIRVNGRKYSIDADPDTPLLTVLREQLDLTGSKYGCGEGQCGACTVLIDGRALRSCMTPVSVAAGRM